MTKLLCPIGTFRELLDELLERGSTSTFRVRGWSMHPTIRDGDVVTVRRFDPTDVLVGDIVVFRRDPAIAVHRVVHVAREGGHACPIRLVTAGDGLRHLDGHTDAKDVMALVTKVTSARGCWSPRSPLRRLHGRMRAAAALHPRVRAVFRSLKRAWPPPAIPRLGDVPEARSGGQR